MIIILDFNSIVSTFTSHARYISTFRSMNPCSVHWSLERMLRSVRHVCICNVRHRSSDVTFIFIYSAPEPDWTERINAWHCHSKRTSVKSMRTISSATKHLSGEETSKRKGLHMCPSIRKDVCWLFFNQRRGAFCVAVRTNEQLLYRAIRTRQSIMYRHWFRSLSASMLCFVFFFRMFNERILFLVLP